MATRQPQASASPIRRFPNPPWTRASLSRDGSARSCSPDPILTEKASERLTFLRAAPAPRKVQEGREEKATVRKLHTSRAIEQRMQLGTRGAAGRSTKLGHQPGVVVGRDAVSGWEGGCREAGREGSCTALTS